jgi:hypothetical protein
MKPLIFDVRANDIPETNIPVIEPWARFTLDPHYAGAWIVAGDVDGDGEVEIVSARNVNANDIHHTCSAIVQRLDGSVLWRWGDPAAGRNQLHHDVACQIVDWVGDGMPEVVVATHEAVIALDGATGEEKRRFPIPPGAADCIVFADLSGGERAADILVKTRYGQIWAYTRDGESLWTVRAPAGYKTAHQPYPIDIDRDGRDEIVAGYAMLNPDGTVRWDLRERGLALGRGHLDCVRPLRLGESAAESSLVLTFCGDHRIALVDGNGNVLWSISGHHFESINVGKVCAGVPGKQIVVDIDHRPWGESPLWVLDEHGSLLGQIVTDGSRHHVLVDWFGQGVESIAMGTAAALFDGEGRRTARFAAPEIGMCARGDMTGDGVPDLILHSNPASEVCVFRNETGRRPEGEVALGTGTNYTLY